MKSIQRNSIEFYRQREMKGNDALACDRILQDEGVDVLNSFPIK
jgi:hypothetical protein